ncbi:MAG: LON peptidase substrate-binding domain-containing protein [Pseudomonadales bacterium]|jgi:Lon protease-like protein|nr:LON peptidase substrate-binding domain-containing protein [Pseudomonadales bacterium]MCC6530011.1 LON peptidase substrate-binding domain-containing protein [Pseudomonadales bacterium]MCP5332854.1 LON peptidase substrate-binding domain-containing protein [Pseudomonadales bacterium]HMW82605.1 LON peptidase substrate-binding domain-containing protein [Pseudomonadales bacterium]HNC76008.1 LON peptidase substrate-binding domain-containing protein [Pseudomonadales bacterium]
MSSSIPLFPLKTTLFPSGRIQLQIFEPRYLEMVSFCMKQKVDFGVVTIIEGEEVGELPRFHPIGTEARIVDFQQLRHNRLGLLVEGGRKFSIAHHASTPSRRLQAEVEWLAPEPPLEVPAGRFEILQSTLQQLLEYPFVERLAMASDPTEARTLGWQLSQLLPLPADEKQALLTLDDPLERLLQLEQIFDALRQEAQ